MKAEDTAEFFIFISFICLQFLIQKCPLWCMPQTQGLVNKTSCRQSFDLRPLDMICTVIWKQGNLFPCLWEKLLTLDCAWRSNERLLASTKTIPYHSIERMQIIKQYGQWQVRDHTVFLLMFCYEVNQRFCIRILTDMVG